MNLIRQDNVLDNERTLAQTRLLNAQGMKVASSGIGALGNVIRQMTPEAKQARENAVLRDKAATQVARAQGVQAEAQVIAPLLAQVEQSQDPAGAYAQAVRTAEAAGIDIPEEFEAYDPENFAMLKSIYTMPPEELTDFQRKIALAGPENAREAAMVALNIAPSADARLRGQTGDKVPSGYRRTNDGNLTYIPGGPADPANKAPGFSVTTADGTTITQGRPMGRSANNTEEKSLASEINLYSQLQNVGKLAGLDENGRMVDTSMLTYKGRAEDWLTKQAEKLGVEPSELARQATFKRTQFITGVEQLFNAYRKEITGAAAAVQELDRLKKSFINMDMSPTEFEAAYQQYSQELQRSMRVRRKLLREGFDLRSKEGGDRMDSLFLSGGDDDPAARFVELTTEHGDEKAFEMMMQEGY